MLVVLVSVMILVFVLWVGDMCCIVIRLSVCVSGLLLKQLVLLWFSRLIFCRLIRCGNVFVVGMLVVVVRLCSGSVWFVDISVSSSLLVLLSVLILCCVFVLLVSVGGMCVVVGVGVDVGVGFVFVVLSDVVVCCVVLCKVMVIGLFQLILIDFVELIIVNVSCRCFCVLKMGMYILLMLGFGWLMLCLMLCMWIVLSLMGCVLVFGVIGVFLVFVSVLFVLVWLVVIVLSCVVLLNVWNMWLVVVVLSDIIELMCRFMCNGQLLCLMCMIVGLSMFGMDSVMFRLIVFVSCIVCGSVVWQVGWCLIDINLSCSDSGFGLQLLVSVLCFMSVSCVRFMRQVCV